MLVVILLALTAIAVGLAARSAVSSANPAGGADKTPGIPDVSPTVQTYAGAPRGFGLTNPAALQPRNPILIDGNGSFTAANGVRSGSGTKTDPYIISDWSIDMANFPNTTAGVWIHHASKYVIVRNVRVYNIDGSGNFYGILLGSAIYPPVSSDWAENITVTHVKVDTMSLGYGIESSYFTKNNNISFSAVYMNITGRDWQYGITCQGGSQNCTIWGNYVDARMANSQKVLHTIGIQTGDGCMIDWGIGYVLPCATVTVAYNTISNATSGGIVSDGTTHSSFFNNMVYQNYPGRKQIPDWVSRGIQVESRSNYTQVHDNVFSNYNNGIEVAGWGGWYWNNTVHDNDWGVVVDANNSFANAAFTLFNSIWNTKYYNNGNGNLSLPTGQYTVVLDGQSGVTTTSFPFQYTNQGGQTISQIGYLWSGTDVTVWYDLTAWGYMKAVTIYDSQVSDYSQNLSAFWSGSNLRVTMSLLTSNDIVCTVTSLTDAAFVGNELTAAAYYQVYDGGVLLTTAVSNIAGSLAFSIPAPVSGSYEIRFSSAIPQPTVSISAPANGSYVTSASPQVVWTLNDPGPGLQSALLSVDGSTNVNVTGQTSYSPGVLSDGLHTVTVTATDLSGLSGSASVSFVVDTHPPTITILAPADESIVNRTSVLVVWNVTDPVSGVRSVNVSLDQGPHVTAQGNEYTFAGLVDGTHTATIEAENQAGLSAAAEVTFTVSVMSGNASNPGGNSANKTNPTVASVAYLPNSSTVDIAFTQSMNQSSVNNSITVSPSVDYSIEWVNQSHVRIVLTNNLSAGMVYQVVLQPSARTTSGGTMRTPFLFQFQVASPKTGTGGLTTGWIPIILLIIVMILGANWLTAGYLVSHYRNNAKRWQSSVARFSKRYAGSIVVVYKKLAMGTRRTKQPVPKVQAGKHAQKAAKKPFPVLYKRPAKRRTRR